MSAAQYFKLPDSVARARFLTELIRNLGARASDLADFPSSSNRATASTEDDDWEDEEEEEAAAGSRRKLFSADDAEAPDDVGKPMGISQIVRQQLRSSRSVVKPDEFDLLIDSGPEGSRGAPSSKSTRSRR